MTFMTNSKIFDYPGIKDDRICRKKLVYDETNTKIY